MRLAITSLALAFVSSGAGCSDSTCPPEQPASGSECRGSAICYYPICPTAGWPNEAHCKEGAWQIISSGCPSPKDAGLEAKPFDGGREAQTSEAGSCTAGSLTSIGRLCVRGEPAKGGEQIIDGAAVKIQLYPKGCFSSSCTVKHQTICTAVASGTAIQVTGLFCLEQKSGSCSTDCNGGGYAECAPGAIAPGSYTASAAGLSVQFGVPSMVPVGGACSQP